MKPLRHARHSAIDSASFAYGLLGIRAPERVFCLHMHSMAVDNEHVCVVCVWVLVRARKGCARAGVVIARRTLSALDGIY